jgi:hypothetical protein
MNDLTYSLTFRLNPNAPLQAMKSDFDSLSVYVFSVAFLITLAGYYAHIWRKRSEPTKTLESLGIMALIVLFAASIAVWRPLVVNIFYWPAEQLASQSHNFDPAQTMSQFSSSLNKVMIENAAAQKDQNTSAIKKAWNFVWNIGSLTTAALGDLIFKFMLFASSYVALFITLPFYFLQRVLIEVLFTFMPIAICALYTPALHNRAMSYISTTCSVLAWPLGFAIVSAATNLVFSTPFFGDTNVSDPNVASTINFQVQYVAPFWQILVGALVNIGGTLLVPPTMFYLFMYGGTHIDPIMSGARMMPGIGNIGKRA